MYLIIKNMKIRNSSIFLSFFFAFGVSCYSFAEDMKPAAPVFSPTPSLSSSPSKGVLPQCQGEEKVASSQQQLKKSLEGKENRGYFKFLMSRSQPKSCQFLDNGLTLIVKFADGSKFKSFHNEGGGILEITLGIGISEVQAKKLLIDEFATFFGGTDTKPSCHVKQKPEVEQSKSGMKKRFRCKEEIQASAGYQFDNSGKVVSLDVFYAH